MLLTFPSMLARSVRNSRGRGCLFRASDGLRLREFAIAANAADATSPLARLSGRIARLPMVEASPVRMGRSRSESGVTPFLGESGAETRRSRTLSGRAGINVAEGGVKSSGEVDLVGKFSRSVSEPDALDRDAERSRRKFCVDKREEDEDAADEEGAGEREFRASPFGEGVESRELDVIEASLLRT